MWLYLSLSPLLLFRVSPYLFPSALYLSDCGVIKAHWCTPAISGMAARCLVGTQASIFSLPTLLAGYLPCVHCTWTPQGVSTAYLLPSTLLRKVKHWPLLEIPPGLSPLESSSLTCVLRHSKPELSRWALWMVLDMCTVKLRSSGAIVTPPSIPLSTDSAVPGPCTVLLSSLKVSCG